MKWNKKECVTLVFRCTELSLLYYHHTSKKIIYVVQVETCFYSANKFCANKLIDFYPFSSRYTPLYRQLQMKKGLRVLIWAKPNAKF